MRKVFLVKRTVDGRAMLNIACGGRMHPQWNNVDFSPLARLARHPRAAGILNHARILSRKRYERLLRTDPAIICWNIRKGIPFEASTFDVVYHSHFLEHLDKMEAAPFLGECHRVLKESGIIRIVVPDLAILCRAYLTTFELLSRSTSSDADLMTDHEYNIERLLGQMARTQPVGTSEQARFLRFAERALRGDASKAGEVHRWMYDTFTLRRLLTENNFRDARAESPSTGRIEGWAGFCLDTNSDGTVYVPKSIYVEAVK
jgi:SAM-dependent methyltransferase